MTGAVAAILGPRGYLKNANHMLKMAEKKDKGILRCCRTTFPILDCLHALDCHKRENHLVVLFKPLLVWSLTLAVKYNLTSDGPVKIKCSYWSRMAPSPLVTFSNQNALTEYIGLCSSSGRADQVIASLCIGQKRGQKNWKIQTLPSTSLWSNGRGRSQSQQKISNSIRTCMIHSRSVSDSKQMLWDFKDRESCLFWGSPRTDEGLGLEQCN